MWSLIRFNIYTYSLDYSECSLIWDMALGLSTSFTSEQSKNFRVSPFMGSLGGTLGQLYQRAVHRGENKRGATLLKSSHLVNIIWSYADLADLLLSPNDWAKT